MYGHKLGRMRECCGRNICCETTFGNLQRVGPKIVVPEFMGVHCKMVNATGWNRIDDAAAPVRTTIVVPGQQRTAVYVI